MKIARYLRHTVCTGVSRSLTSTLLILVSLNSAAQHEHHHMAADVNWSHEAVRNGNWNDSRTWRGNRIPGDDATVLIPQGRTVTLARQNSSNLGVVMVEGNLHFRDDVDTRLITDTLNVAASGRLQIGTASNPIARNVTAEVVFNDRRSVPFDSGRSNLGLMASGEITIYGASKAARKSLTRDATAGSSSVSLQGRRSGNWANGDEILVTATHFRRNAALQNEVRTINRMNRRGVASLDRALDFSHIRGAGGQMPVYVANLTRNVIFRSATPGNLNSRGHIMFMPSSTVDVNFASFIGLGRTDKTRGTSNTNPQGRYAFHFHRNGLNKVQKVNGIVVRGTPGWGIVNHSSYVDITNSIVHDFAGAAFITEAGDELGSFVGNLAAGGTNAPNHPKMHSRHAFGKLMGRFHAGDLGFSAIGFWLAGPKVDLIDNVVAGSRGTAFFYFSMGNYEPGSPNQMTGLPMDRVDDSIKVARWTHGNQFASGQGRGSMAMSSYLGTGVFRGNDAYGVYQGLRLRWTGHHARQILKRMPNQGTARIDGNLNIRRNRNLYGSALLEDSQFWNVEEGVSITYSSRVTMRNVNVFNDTASGQQRGSTALRAFTGNTETPLRFENVSFSDFDTGLERKCNATMQNVRVNRIRNEIRCDRKL